MVRSERGRLTGGVEVDETFAGGVVQGGKRGRGSSRSIVVIAIEVKEPKGFGRVRMRHIPEASAANLQPFICDVVDRSATVRTDGWKGYNGLSKLLIRRLKVRFLHGPPEIALAYPSATLTAHSFHERSILVSCSKPSHQFLNEAISQRINSFPDNAEPNGIAMT